MNRIIKKIITFIITLLLISVVTFLAFEIIPGDQVTSMLGTDATPEMEAALREELGLNNPLHIRYMDWLSGVLSGDLGLSYNYRLPISDILQDKIIVTVTLGILSFLIILIVSIPLGIWCARAENSIVDRCITAVTQISMAVPSFFLGMIIVLVFGLILKWFTPSGYVSFHESVSGFLGFLVFPAIAVAIPKIAMVIKFLRNSIREEMKKDYVRTAYSKGNNKNGVMYAHVLKNAIIPVITFLAMAFADILAGSIVIEQVFDLPGLGRLLVTSIGARDYPVVQIIVLYIAAVVVAINFLVDVIYQLVDPRIRIK